MQFSRIPICFSYADIHSYQRSFSYIFLLSEEKYVHYTSPRKSLVFNIPRKKGLSRAKNTSPNASKRRQTDIAVRLGSCCRMYGNIWPLVCSLRDFRRFPTVSFLSLTSFANVFHMEKANFPSLPRASITKGI